jgi:hypothetical protein
MGRMRAFGHGVSTPMAAEEALAVARAAEPEPVRTSERFDEDPAVGALVRVRADDYAKDAIEGELVMIGRDEVVLHREDKEVGSVHVHFPRLEYDLREASW